MKFLKVKVLQSFFLFAFISASTHSASAYFSTLSTGEVIAPKEYRFTFETQAILSGATGLNFTGFLDTGVNESSEVRILVGAGKTDFVTGLFYKWIPIPDVDNQPALGILAGATYARVDGVTQLTTRFHPLISKKFHFNDIGTFNAYASIPFGMTYADGAGLLPTHIALGSEYKTDHIPDLVFGAELGIDVKDAFSYLSAFITIYLSDDL